MVGGRGRGKGKRGEGTKTFGRRLEETGAHLTLVSGARRARGAGWEGRGGGQRGGEVRWKGRSWRWSAKRWVRSPLSSAGVWDDFGWGSKGEEAWETEASELGQVLCVDVQCLVRSALDAACTKNIDRCEWEKEGRPQQPYHSHPQQPIMPSPHHPTRSPATN